LPPSDTRHGSRRIVPVASSGRIDRSRGPSFVFDSVIRRSKAIRSSLAASRGVSPPAVAAFAVAKSTAAPRAKIRLWSSTTIDFGGAVASAETSPAKEMESITRPSNKGPAPF
jgi:hypothetical protein